MSSVIKIACLIGVTGQGKSSLANSLCGEMKFKTSNAMISETTDVECILTNFFGEPGKEILLVIDTPGIGDSRHIDSNHIHNIVVSLKTIGYVHSFVIVINS